MGIFFGGYFFGVSGFFGSIDLIEKGGELLFDSVVFVLLLFVVFFELDIVFDSLKVRIIWKIDGVSVDIKLEKFDFVGLDVDGLVCGIYCFNGDGFGEIDFVVNVDCVDGCVVWCYMLYVVNVDVCDWICCGIVVGCGYDGWLVLKGNLKDFFFCDSSKGKFIVIVKVVGVKVDYVLGWLVIENIVVDMSFGIGMKIVVSQGGIFGVKLFVVIVEILDFELYEEMLFVWGLVQGLISEFFCFID